MALPEYAPVGRETPTRLPNRWTKPRRRKGGLEIGSSRFADKSQIRNGGSAVRAASYSRASSDPRLTGTSVDSQNKHNDGVMVRHEWTCDPEDRYTDNNVGASEYSAKAESREAYGALMDRIEGGQLDVIVMYSISRRGRELQEYLKLRKHCLKAGVFFWYFDGDLYDLRDLNDKFMIAVKQIISELHADQISQYARGVIAQRAEDGVPHGKPSFGYMRVLSPHRRKFAAQVFDKRRFTTKGEGPGGVEYSWSPYALVREMYRDVLKARSLSFLAERLNLRGVPCPRLYAALNNETPLPPERWKDSTWSGKTVRDLLLNPANIGEVWIDSKLCNSHGWDPIIDPEIYYAVRDLLEDSQRHTGAPTQEPKYLLSGVTRCGVCGRTMSGLGPKPEHRRPRSMYRCRSRRGCVGIDMERYDSYITSVVIRYITEPGRLDGLLAANAREQASAARARNEAARLREKRLTVVAAIENQADTLTPDEAMALGRQISALDRMIAEAESSARAASMPRALRQFAGVSDAREARMIWDRLTIEKRRSIVGELLEVKVFPLDRRPMSTPVAERVTVSVRTL